MGLICSCAISQIQCLALLFFVIIAIDMLLFLKILFIYISREEGREKERETNINVWLPLAHPILGAWPATQA